MRSLYLEVGKDDGARVDKGAAVDKSALDGGGNGACVGVATTV